MLTRTKLCLSIHCILHAYQLSEHTLAFSTFSTSACYRMCQVTAQWMCHMDSLFLGYLHLIPRAQILWFNLVLDTRYKLGIALVSVFLFYFSNNCSN